jgi:hypothetical protein
MRWMRWDGMYASERESDQTISDLHRHHRAITPSQKPTANPVSKGTYDQLTCASWLFQVAQYSTPTDNNGQTECGLGVRWNACRFV